MNEEFKNELKRLKTEANLAAHAIRLFTDAYIKKNREFADGDKVLISFKNGRKEYAYIKSAGVFDDGEMYYIFLKAKKDGSKSSIRLRGVYVQDGFTITKV